MHQPGFVGGVECASDLLRHVQRFLGRQRPARPEQRLEARPVDVTHGEKQDAVDLVGVVDRDHVRMLERRCELRLAQEPRAEVFVVRQLG